MKIIVKAYSVMNFRQTCSDDVFDDTLENGSMPFVQIFIREYS